MNKMYLQPKLDTLLVRWEERAHAQRSGMKMPQETDLCSEHWAVNYTDGKQS